MKTCHLVLKYKYYKQIEEGTKTIEYRDKTDHWLKRIMNATRVVFYKGYSKTKMMFNINRIILTKTTIEIYLGARVDV